MLKSLGKFSVRGLYKLRMIEARKTTIIIDTSRRDIVRVGLRVGGKEHEVVEQMNREKAQVVLPLLQSLLKEQDMAIQDIEAIEVHTGPGSFTGLRVGVAIANTLGMILKVPINGRKVGELVEPTYQ